MSNPRPTYTRSELAHKYGVHINTLNRWLQRAGIVVPRHTKVLTPQMVDLVKEKIGPWE